jgi:hypothetical protein
MLEYALSFSEERRDDILAIQLNARLVIERHWLVSSSELVSAAIDIKAMRRAGLLGDIDREVYGYARRVINELERIVMGTCRTEHAQGLKELFDELRSATSIGKQT